MTRLPDEMIRATQVTRHAPAYRPERKPVFRWRLFQRPKTQKLRPRLA